jgi:hypothetical protein
MMAKAPERRSAAVTEAELYRELGVLTRNRNE